MTKQELASYCANLLAILESKDRAGGLNRGGWLAKEYERAYNELKAAIKGEGK